MKNKILLLRYYSSKLKKFKHGRNLRTPLVFGYLASILKKDSDVDFLDMMIEEKNVLDYIIKKKYNRIIVQTISNEIDEFSKFVEIVKKNGVRIIAFGQGPTYMPKKYSQILDKTDYVVLGEPENAIKEIIVDKKDCRKIENVYMKNKKAKIGISEFSQIGMPDFSIYDYNNYLTYYPLQIFKKVKWGYIETSRGCPHKCKFCSPTIRTSYSNKIRYKNDKQIRQELLLLKKKGINVISIEDDNFSTNSEHVKKVCEIIKKIGLKWIAQMRIDEVDHGLLLLLKKSGCINIRFGIETFNKKYLEYTQKTVRKESWKQRTFDIVNYCNKINISTTALFQVGFPGQTKADVSKEISDAIRLNSTLIQVAYLTPYPGSLIAKTLNVDDKKFLYHYSSDEIYNCTNMTDKELKRYYSMFYKKFYFRFNKLIDQYYRFGIFYLLNFRIWLGLFRTMS